jgi:hypothetical protein
MQRIYALKKRRGSRSERKFWKISAVFQLISTGIQMHKYYKEHSGISISGACFMAMGPRVGGGGIRKEVEVGQTKW